MITVDIGLGGIKLIKNILQCLEESEKKYPNKMAFAEINQEVTYQEFTTKAKKIGSNMSSKIGQVKKPVVIFIDKTIHCLETMMGVIYSGNFYTIMDINSPEDRINTIMNTLEPIAVITDEKNLVKAQHINSFKTILVYEEMIQSLVLEEVLNKIRIQAIDTDPMYVLFTSGSTGIPKGTVVCHRSVIDYASWVKETFAMNENTIFGSQTPFYFSMSILDIFTTILTGATFYIIPKMYFSFPIKLLDFMKGKKINTIYWVPSALCIVANLKALEEVKLPDLKKILFAGEVMPVKQLNSWRKHLPNAIYANLYGPTEITDIASYYIVNREFQDTETLPIGRACDNCDVMIIKENGIEAKEGEEGELCVRGSFLALGYYNNPDKTNKAFVQNPLQHAYPELIYKTGDIVTRNERGEILYLSRKDFQIKHMGYRIELGEIETLINTIDGIIACCCVYEEESSELILFYQGISLEEKEIREQAKQKLLSYMQPNKIQKLDKMPYNANGKMDRVALKKYLKEKEK